MRKVGNILAIGYVMCPVYDYVHVLRCYKCHQYNHKASECPNNVTCGKCSSTDHKTIECDCNTFKCINCASTNRNLNLHLDDSHTVFDIKCPIYVKMIGHEKGKVEYSINKQ